MTTRIGIAPVLIIGTLVFIAAAPSAPAADAGPEFALKPVLQTDGRGIDFAGLGITCKFWGAPRPKPAPIAAHEGQPTVWRTYQTPRRIIGDTIAQAGGMADTPALVATTETPVPRSVWGDIGAWSYTNRGALVASGLVALAGGIVTWGEKTDWRFWNEKTETKTVQTDTPYVDVAQAGKRNTLEVSVPPADSGGNIKARQDGEGNVIRIVVAEEDDQESAQ